MARKILTVMIFFIFGSCARYVTFPPEIDLMPLEKIGLISFSVENAKGPLDEMATQFFLEEITRFQRGVQIIELGEFGAVLEKVDKNELDQEAIKAIGNQFGVNSIFNGKITVSKVKPKLGINFLVKFMQVRATFTMSVTGRLLSTKSGVTSWTDSVIREGTLAYVRMGKNLIPYFDIRNQDNTYKRFIRQIIHELTRDFRPSRRRGRY